jgi:hypothetical protein
MASQVAEKAKSAYFLKELGECFVLLGQRGGIDLGQADSNHILLERRVSSRS